MIKENPGSTERTVNTKNATVDFGKKFAGHMVTMDYKTGRWLEPVIEPFGNISISPAALGLHYGQLVFEGMKAFRMEDGNISVFRIEKHYERLSRSLSRMCMPAPEFSVFKKSLTDLIALDQEWVPEEEGSSLYIRPFMFASEEKYGVSISNEYKFMIFSGPVGQYYSKPLRMKIEDQFSRASAGGTGAAKCAGNYGGAFYPTELARQAGFDQVIWTDLTSAMNIEEAGTMNILFVIDDVLVSPMLSDTTLAGITRDSFLTLAKDLGYKTAERKIPASELTASILTGRCTEAFGSGTAAVVSPIESIYFKGVTYQLPVPDENSFMMKAKKLLSAIRCGIAADKYHWNTILEV